MQMTYMSADSTSASVSPELCPWWEPQFRSPPSSNVCSVVVLNTSDLCVWCVPWVFTPPPMGPCILLKKAQH